MPAKKKTTPQTAVALRRLTDAMATPPDDGVPYPTRGSVYLRRGVEQTPGYTYHLGKAALYRNDEPSVFVLKRRVRLHDGSARSEDADPLVTALWDTLPEEERRRSRLFFHCPECSVRFTKKGAIADAARCGRVRMYDPPNARERTSAEVRAGIEPPRLDPQDGYEECVAEVWDELSPLHRRTLYAHMRPTDWRREWAREGAPSPESFRSRVRVAERALARALAARYYPDEDFSIKTRGRRGFDYARFWSMFG